MSPGRKHLPAEERRAVIVRTVLDLAGERHPSKITTAAIAERMGLTQGALFRHFPNKDAVWQAVMDWVADRLLARIEQAAEGVDSPLAQLEAIFLAHVAFVIEHPGVPRILFAELQRPDGSPVRNAVQRLMQRYAERLVMRIEQGQAVGEIDPGVEPGTAAMALIGMVQGLVMQSLLAGDVTRMRAAAPPLFALYRRGLEVHS